MLQDMINKLNPMQREGVLTTEGAVLLLAGAGSGKTRVLTHRIAYLIEKGVNPFNILAITFTNKAAKEMKERVAALCERGNEVWVSTFHSTCVRILRREIDKLGYANQFTIYDADDSLRLIRNILKDLNVSEKVYDPKFLAGEIGRQKDMLVSPNEYMSMVERDFRLKKVAEIYAVYQQRLKENNCLDFDDLIFKTVELFRTKPEVLKKYRDRFKYIMVDEYQDTNMSQYELIKLLSGENGNLCVVGDDDQSIYGWRGADIRNILDFEKDFKNTKVIKLEQNYRSTGTILDAANKVIKNNLARKSKKLWTESGQGEKIGYYNGNSDIEEALFICKTVSEGHNNGREYKNYAVLYRNNALSRTIEEQLVKNNIPYRLLGGTRFYDRKEIRDIIGYLKAINNPHDNMAVRRIINVPKRGIGDTSLERVAAYANEEHISIYTALENIENVPDIKGTAKKNFPAFLELMEGFREAAKTMDIYTLVDTVLTETGYREELMNENTEEAKNRLENLNELLNKAGEFDEKENGSLPDFLEDIALVADVDGYDETEDTVVLMTLHSSKGLEFDTVFIAGFEENIFPGYRAITDPSPSALEEERRLCYVGITRAKRKLYLTGAKSRFQHGNYISNMPSRFLKELPTEYIEVLEPYAKKLQVNTQRPAFSRTVSTYKPVANSYKMPDTAKTGNSSIPSPSYSPDFAVGDKVRHIKFGSGTVLKIDPAGADYEVTVEFKAGTKKLMAKLSRLTKL